MENVDRRLYRNVYYQLREFFLSSRCGQNFALRHDVKFNKNNCLTAFRKESNMIPHIKDK